MLLLQKLGDALATAGNMAWEILWPLILGFTLSAVIQAVVRRERISRLMAADSPRALSIATGLGAASSSCSYAAVALARSLFRKGASFTSAMAFEIASTNLVVELGIILAIAMGWQFTLAEFIAGPIMIVFVALLFRLFLRKRIVEAAREQADKGVAGSMEGHAGMDMSVQMDAPFLQRLFSRAGLTSTSQYFVMDWAAVLRDIVIGLLIAGAFAAWVPKEVLQTVFLANDPALAFLLGPLIGPLVAVVSFVCSVGNVPLAAVLWNGGISFGGVMSFIFADLIIIPILLIYRKYYGTRPPWSSPERSTSRWPQPDTSSNCSSHPSASCPRTGTQQCSSRQSAGTTPPGSTSSSWPSRRCSSSGSTSPARARCCT